MFKLLNKIPRDVVIACSGGIDSMVVVDFLKKNHNIELAFFHHGTKTSDEALDFLEVFSKENNLKLHIGYLKKEFNGGSLEEFWRDERYKFLESFEKPVITCHHLDDVLETWIFSSANGNPKVIPYSRKNIIRPFLLNKKEKFEYWSKKHFVSYKNDRSNYDLRFKRNYIRHKVVPLYKEINIGIYKVLKKKYLKKV